MDEDQRKQEEEEEFGKKKTTRMHDSRQPREQERIEHEMTHLPFRSLCRPCIKRRGREENWRKSIVDERHVPKIHLGYMCMGDEKEGKTLAIVASRGKPTNTNESCAQRPCSEEAGGRLDMSKADGIAA